MSKYVIDGETLKGIADAIREKTEKGEPILTENFASEIAKIDKDVSAIKILERSSDRLYIPEGTTKLAANVFREWYTLPSVTIPDSVTVIENNAFHDCRTLKELKLSNNLEEIKNYAFANCYLISEIKIPKSVKKIGNSVFYDCKGCRLYDFSEHVSPPQIGTSLFALITGTVERIIVVPTNLYLTWISSVNWSSWCSDIVSIGKAKVNTVVPNSEIWLRGGNSWGYAENTDGVNAYCQHIGGTKYNLGYDAEPYGLIFNACSYQDGYDYIIEGDAVFPEAGRYEIWVENKNGIRLYRRIIDVS